MRYGFEPPNQPSKMVEIDCVVIRSTEKAYLITNGVIKNGQPETFWIPKSQIDDYTEGDDEEITSIFIPEWLATEKGLV